MYYIREHLLFAKFTVNNESIQTHTFTIFDIYEIYILMKFV